MPFTGSTFILSLATPLDVATGVGRPIEDTLGDTPQLKLTAVIDEPGTASPQGDGWGLTLDRAFLTTCKAAIRWRFISGLASEAWAESAYAAAYYTASVPNGPKKHRNGRALGRAAYRNW